MSILLYLLLSVVTIFLLIYLYFQYKYTYWMSKNIYFTPPTFPYGNFSGINKTHSIGQILKKIYLSNKDKKAVGTWLFAKPTLLITDLEFIKTILIKEFNSFMDRGLLQSHSFDPLTGHLFFLNGKKWRNVRIKLTPTFTSGKMKMMFPILLKCGENFKKYLEEPASKDETVEIKSACSNFTMDVIASCAFGLDINIFENPESEFIKTSDFLFKPSNVQAFKNMLTFAAPWLLRLLKIKSVPENVTNFFTGAIEDAFNYREESKTVRNDFVQLLLELKNKGKIEDSEVYKHGELEAEEEEEFDPTFSVNEAAAQAFVFFVAGFETSSTVMMFCLYELALNQDIQDKLRDEIDRVIAKYNGQITYEGLQEMEYLDQVFSETMRKYPPAPMIIRECTKNIYLSEVNAVIEKGTSVMIPMLGIHHDPEYYPDPEKFDPDRFSPENKEKRNPLSYMPFGDGPRICIGMRFAQMQTKAGLTILLSNYKVEASLTRTPPPGRLEYNPKVFLTAIKGGLGLKIKKR